MMKLHSVLKANLVAFLVVVLSASEVALAANITVTLDATADHSGLVRNNGTAVGQYGRPDTLWGTTNNSILQRRNGMVQFESLNPAIRDGLISGLFTLNSATLELWNTTNSWASTPLNFARLPDSDSDWAALNGPDNGGDGVSSWNNKVQSVPTDWASSDGAGYTTNPQIFGTLTSQYAGGGNIGDVKWEVPLSGSQLFSWLTDDTIAPNLLVWWNNNSSEGSGNQTRFATINTDDGVGDPYAANLVLDITVPEPSSSLIALPVLLGLGLLAKRRVS